MKLTKFQESLLSYYQQNRESQLTILSILSSAWKSYLVLIVLVAGIIVIAWYLDWLMITYLVAGLVIGALLRDIGYAHRSAKFWPVLMSIIEWRKVEELLNKEKEFSR